MHFLKLLSIPVMGALLMVSCSLAPYQLLESEKFVLQYPGSEQLIDYSQYGMFKYEGTPHYRYQITELEGLKNAAGSGVYPNRDFAMLDTLYSQVIGLPDYSTDFFAQGEYPKVDYFKSLSAKEGWALRHYYAADALVRTGEILQALKTYYAIVVHFPTEFSYRADGKEVWYIAQSAITKIKILVGKHPQLGLQYSGSSFVVKNTNDYDVTNDVVIVNPGRITGEAVGAAINGGVPGGYERAIEKRDTGLLKTAVVLSDMGQKEFIDYGLYGTFAHQDGSGVFGYTITDSASLVQAAGEGIYPNQSTVLSNELYVSMKTAEWLTVECFETFSYNSPLLQYLSFATVTETSNPGRSINKGEKLFFTGVALQSAGEEQQDLNLIRQAVKAYYAVIVHFPGDASMARDSSYVWYPAKASIGKITFLLEQYPELGTALEQTVITIANEFDIDTSNDTVTVSLGRLVPAKDEALPGLDTLKVVERRCGGKKSSTDVCDKKVYAEKYEHGHWQLFADGKPYMVQGVSYYPTAVGNSPKDGTALNWMKSDRNNNGKADTPYDAWLDKNHNNTQDSNELSVGDFALMQEMGANTIRYYHTPVEKRIAREGQKDSIEITYDSEAAFDKSVLRDLYQTYGIRVILGDYIGAYLIGSGADPKIGTDYRDPIQRERMKSMVRALVMDHKDEPYVLLWVLGNENNMRTDYEGANMTMTLASQYPEAYCRFLNEVAVMIHEIDPDHPVMIGNLETQLMEYYGEHASAIDILGVNSYRGKEGFGDLFHNVQSVFDRPLLISEYGSDVLDIRNDGTTINEMSQLNYHKGTWGNIMKNSAGNNGVGNAIGGIAFEWVDEWWKSALGSKNNQDIDKDAPMPFQDGWSSEEYFGIMGQGEGIESPYMRQPRKVYYYYKSIWPQVQ
ncbi:MAG: hypothetical protein OCD01_03350 [Fibrobacterales bacterium]